MENHPQEMVIPRVRALLALPHDHGSVRQETTNPHHSKSRGFPKKTPGSYFRRVVHSREHTVACVRFFAHMLYCGTSSAKGTQNTPTAIIRDEFPSVSFMRRSGLVRLEGWVLNGGSGRRFNRKLNFMLFQTAALACDEW